MRYVFPLFVCQLPPVAPDSCLWLRGVKPDLTYCSCSPYPLKFCVVYSKMLFILPWILRGVYTEVCIAFLLNLQCLGVCRWVVGIVLHVISDVLQSSYCYFCFLLVGFFVFCEVLFGLFFFNRIIH